MEDFLVSAKKAAELLGISRSHFYKLHKLELLGPMPIDLGDRTLWSRKELEEWTDKHCPNREKWLDVFKRLRVQGFGDFYLKDKFIIIRTPFINHSEFWGGFLESLLGVSLEARTVTPPLVFEVTS